MTAIRLSKDLIMKESERHVYRGVNKLDFLLKIETEYGKNITEESVSYYQDVIVKIKKGNGEWEQIKDLSKDETVTKVHQDFLLVLAKYPKDMVVEANESSLIHNTISQDYKIAEAERMEGIFLLNKRCEDPTYIITEEDQLLYIETVSPEINIPALSKSSEFLIDSSISYLQNLMELYFNIPDLFDTFELLEV